jgi:Uma2 family endonuclease
MRRVERVRARVSFADLQRMPDDGNRYELHDGELCVVPSPLPIHQIVAQRLFLALNEFARDDGGAVFMAPFDIVLSDYDVAQPDLIYFGPEAARRIDIREHIPFAPDIAIEVLSPTTARLDRGRKCDLFARYGIAEYWIVDPDARLAEVRILDAGRYSEPLIIRSGRYESRTRTGLSWTSNRCLWDSNRPDVTSPQTASGQSGPAPRPIDRAARSPRIARAAQCLLARTCTSSRSRSSRPHRA